jgi:hypothetical protein
MKRAALWASVLLFSACTSANNPAGAASTPSATSTAAANPTAITTPTPVTSPMAAYACTPGQRCVALVTLRGSNRLVVRDITDIAHPKTVGTVAPAASLFGYGPALGGAEGQFLSATSVTYVGDKTDAEFGLPTGLFRAATSGATRTQVVRGSKALVAAAWSRDGRVVYYVTATVTSMQLHMLRAGQDRILASLPSLGVGGCESDPCPGPFANPADNWDVRLALSPNGEYISLVWNGVGSSFRVWNWAGGAFASTDSEASTMSVWSGNGLYFRDSRGVEVWRTSGTTAFLPGVAWIRPKASPDGRHIVYAARDATGSAHVYFVDTGTRQVTEIGEGRAEPAFLTDRYIWYQAEAACVTAQTCKPSFPGIATGKTYIYDLNTGTESSSLITSVIDVWPHTE